MLGCSAALKHRWDLDHRHASGLQHHSGQGKEPRRPNALASTIPGQVNTGNQVLARMSQNTVEIQILTAAELAARLKVRPSWVVEQSKRCRTADPIPSIRFGRHKRFAWGGAALTAWLNRRLSGRSL